MRLRTSLSNWAWIASVISALGLTSTAAAQDEDLLEDGSVLQSGSSSSEAAREGAAFLLLPTGARASAMGGAVTAMRGWGEGVIWNPAGIAALEGRRFLVNHSENAFDTKTDVLSLILPTEKFGTLGLTYYLVDFGKLDNTDEQGRVQGNISFRNQEFLLTYSGRLGGGLEGGVNYKLIQLIYRCDGLCPEQRSFTRTSHAFDFGLIYGDMGGLPLTVGGSIRHLGFALRGETESDLLPTRVRVGAAYEALSSFTADSVFTLILAVDVEDRVRGFGNPDVMVGSEFSVLHRFFLRAGYAFVDTGASGAALGLGLTYDWFFVDLSRGFDEISSATGEESIQVSFGVIF